MARQTFDFYTQQEKAKKTSRFFIIAFVICVVLTVISVYCVVIIAGNLLAPNAPEIKKYFSFTWKNDVFFMFSVFFIVIALGVLFSSLYKVFQLKKQGAQGLAISLGGQKIDLVKASFTEKRLINIVEEMAIASGLPVPEIFILKNEDSINAFAAGFSPQTAVIGVTKGALDYLDRDELQGVIAHEFGHILSGDMKLNLNIIAWLFGLTCLFTAGLIIFRVAGQGSSKKGGVIFFFFLAAALTISGTIGRYAAQILQAAISRQREFLADATAAQFTRNPLALARTFKKIAGLNNNKLSSPEILSSSHLFFSAPLKSLFNTHPALEKRILALDPTWDGKYIKPPKNQISEKIIPKKKEKETKNPSFLIATPIAVLLESIPMGNLALSAAILEQIPNDLHEATKNSSEIETIVGTILFDEKQKDLQTPILKKFLGQEKTEKALRWQQEIKEIKPDLRLTLLDLLAPVANNIKSEEKQKIISLATEMIKADNFLSLFEYCILQILKSSLYKKDEPEIIKNFSQKELQEPTECLFTFLALMGHQNDLQEAKIAYTKAQQSFNDASITKSLKTLNSPIVTEITKHLLFLNKANSAIKKRILEACLVCVMHDSVITEHEHYLIRAIATLLNYPLPLI